MFVESFDRLSCTLIFLKISWGSSGCMLRGRIWPPSTSDVAFPWSRPSKHLSDKPNYIPISIYKRQLNLMSLNVWNAVRTVHEQIKIIYQMSAGGSLSHSLYLLTWKGSKVSWRKWKACVQTQGGFYYWVLYQTFTQTVLHPHCRQGFVLSKYTLTRVVPFSTGRLPTQ